MHAEGGRDPQTGEPWVRQEPGRRSSTERGGRRTGERRHRLVRETPLGFPVGDESADKWWRPAGGVAVQVDVCSATGRDRGGRSGCKEIKKRSQQVKYGGEIVDRPRERGGNDPEHGCYRWDGVI